MSPSLIKKLVTLIVVIGVAIGGYRVYLLLAGMHARSQEGILRRPLRVGIVSWPGYAGGIVANNGFEPNTDCIFSRANLEVEFVLMEDTAERAKAFVEGGERGGVDIVWSTVDYWANELPSFITKGIRARAILQVDWSRGGDAIVADEDIKRVEDLKGKRVSLAKFTPSHWLLTNSVETSSLQGPEKELILTTLALKDSSPEARKDFVEDRADAAVVWEPDVTAALLKRPRSHILLDTATADHLIADVMVAREDFIKKYPDVIRAFVKGWLDGTAEANRDPGLAVRLLMENEPDYGKLDKDAVREGLSKVTLATLYENTEMFGLDGSECLFDILFKDAGRAWARRRYISAPLPPEQSRDEQFIRQIYDEVREDLRPHVIRDENVFPRKPPARIDKQPAVATARFNIYFDEGKAEPNDNQVLVEIAKTALKNSNAYLRVEGNTDNVGDPMFNRSLSKRRAEAVINHLVTQYGFKRERFVPIGNGDSKPVASNDTSEGREKNRRTDVMLLKRE